LTGMYSDTLVAFNNCDSIVNLSLVVNLPVINNIVATTCTGESFTVGDSIYMITGMYSDTLIGINACDSIVNLDLTVSDFYETNLSEVICEGESFAVGDSVYIETGIYIDPLFSLSGCDSMVTLNLTVLDPSVNILLPDTLDCLIAELTLLATIDITLPGTTIEVNWSHLDNGGDGIIGNTTTLSVLVNKSGLYEINVIETFGGQSCMTTETVLVLEQDEDIENVLTISENPTCLGEMDGWVAVTAVEGGAFPLSYRLNGVVEIEVPPIWRGLGAGTYDLVVEDANGCQWDTTFNLITPNSVVVFLPEDQSIQLGDSVVFEAQINLPLEQINTLLWSPSNLLDCDTCYEQQYTPLETIQFTAKVIDENGCESSDDILIEVIKDRLVFIPNAFSPNGDGKNDHFMIYSGTGIVEINSFQIYDRYGAQVYKANNFQPNDPAYSWDGYYLGKPLNPAVFAFFAEIRFIDGITLLYKGDVTIVK
jgi:gliding motility-associated-like protein